MASGEESLSSIDDDRYRAEVLGLDGDETEDRIEARLVTDATNLGLRVPDIQIAASLAASISAGFLDIISSSSTSTPTRSSLAHSSLPDVARCSGAATAASIDHLASSFSDTTLSDRGHSDSIPSIDSSSTCPTSISSYDGRPSLHNEQYARGQCNSHSSVARSTERKRSSFIHAIGKPFRRRRMPSAVNLPPDVQIVLRREGVDSTVLVETKTVTPSSVENPASQEKVHVEVPVFDEASMQRSLDNEQLRDMFSRHKAVRLRFVRLQNDVLDTLKGKHLAVIAEQKIRNEIAEREKEKQVRITIPLCTCIKLIKSRITLTLPEWKSASSRLRLTKSKNSTKRNDTLKSASNIWKDTSTRLALRLHRLSDQKPDPMLLPAPTEQ